MICKTSVLFLGSVYGSIMSCMTTYVTSLFWFLLSLLCILPWVLGNIVKEKGVISSWSTLQKMRIGFRKVVVRSCHDHYKIKVMELNQCGDSYMGCCCMWQFYMSCLLSIVNVHSLLMLTLRHFFIFFIYIFFSCDKVCLQAV